MPGVSAAASLRRATAATPAVFPYTPTTILVPSSNGSLVYIFAPDDSGQVSFLSLNISSTLSAEAADRVTTLSQGVPFLSGDGQENTISSFTASVRADGAVVVYAGDCTTDVASVWTYVPPTDDAASDVQWTEGAISLGSSQSGPWFLGGSTAYSSQLEPTVSNATLYVYGGMCPATSTSTATVSSASSSSTPITASNWQSQASYSSNMLKLVPSDDTYVPSTLSNQGHPVAEAGFTMTELSPSLTNLSGTVTQQVNSVLLGGHTKSAFINMSTAALWSLPQESWSFVSIVDPTATSSDSSQQTTAPDSRSGHTAVLSEDGTSIVILGGWVGDVAQAADPQLAILELGTGYGQWQWSIPASQPSGSGIYGHGAAMLPGNVMVVYGGYNISSSSSAKLVRRQASEGSLQFFNLTSQSWSTEYTNPLYAAASSAASSQSAPPSGSPSKVGLGVGLGLGIPLALLLATLIFAFWRRRRNDRRRRDDAVRTLAEDNNRFLQGHDEIMETGGYPAFPTSLPSHDQSGFYTDGHGPYNLAASPAFPTYQSPNLASSSGDGATVRVQPPRNVARGMYQPTSMSDYEASLAIVGATSAASAAGIHPIYEADEEDDEGGGRSAAVQAPRGTHGRGVSVITTESTDRPVSALTEELPDPFMTPSTVSMAVSPMRSIYAGAFAPATIHLNPFARNTPSPEADGAYSSHSRPGSPGFDTGAGFEREKENDGTDGGGASAAGQDQDVQHWVAGLAIEDLLFSPPVPGAAAAVAASVSPAPSQIGAAGSQRGRSSPTNVGYWSSLRHKTSGAGSPTRSSFLGGSHGRSGGGGDDEARTGSNLSDRSAFTFISHTASSRSRRGGAGAYTMLEPKASNSDTSTATYTTAPAGFQTLRVEGPGLLYGSSHTEKDGGNANSSTGDKGMAGTDPKSSMEDGFRVAGLAPAVLLHRSGEESSPDTYGGAASVMVSGARVGGATSATAAYAPLDYFRKPRGNYEEDEDDMALSGSPSKRKSRRTWVNSFKRIFSSGVPENAQNQDASQEYAVPGGMGTGAQQEPNFRDVAHATLLRRKQGRFDWEADEVREEESTAVGTLRTGRSASAASARGLSHGHGYSYGQGNSGPATSGAGASGSIAAGRRDGSGNSDEWDVEKAVQNRVVQVMFTMPRDQQLRVVNGEAEKEDEDAESASLQRKPSLLQRKPTSLRRKPSSVTRPRDGLTEYNEKVEENHLGGLSPPPPTPPAHGMQRPAPSYQRDLETEDVTASRALAETSGHHDELLLRMEEDLAGSKQRLAERVALEPSWIFQDEDKSQSEKVSETPAVTPATLRGTSSKGKSADAADRSSGFLLQRPITPENRPTRAVAAILQAGGPAGRRTPSPAKTIAETENQPTTPNRALRPVRSAAGLHRTPTQTPTRTPRSLGRHETPSFESQLTGRPSRESFHSAASSRWHGSTLLGSPGDANAPGLVKKSSRYVLGMVEKIEMGSPPKSPTLV